MPSAESGSAQPPAAVPSCSNSTCRATGPLSTCVAHQHSPNSHQRRCAKAHTPEDGKKKNTSELIGWAGVGPGGSAIETGRPEQPGGCNGPHGRGGWRPRGAGRGSERGCAAQRAQGRAPWRGRRQRPGGLAEPRARDAPGARAASPHFQGSATAAAAAVEQKGDTEKRVSRRCEERGAKCSAASS